MSRNVGRIDQYVRIVVGLALVAFAFQDGPSIQGSPGWFGRISLAGHRLLQQLPGVPRVRDIDL